jgi:hypothetical protein
MTTNRITELKTKMAVLEQQTDTIWDEHAVLKEELDTLESQDFVKVLPGTSWSIGKARNNLSLDYRQHEANTNPVIKAMDKFQLWPHGRRTLIPGIELSCCDSDIYITTGDVCPEKYLQDREKREDAELTALLAFAKSAGIVVNLRHVSLDAIFCKDQLDKALAREAKLKAFLKV